MMKKILSLFLACLMVLSLCACNSSEKEPVFTEVHSINDVNQELGYKMLELESKADAITWSSAEFCPASDEEADDAVGQLSYVSGKSVIDLRMTMDPERGEGLAGYQNAGWVASVDAPSNAFGPLDIYVIHSDLFFSEFSYTNNGATCYLSLSKSKTNLDSYSDLLIEFANQLYNMTEIPDFALLQQRKEQAEAALQQADDARKEIEQQLESEHNSDLPPVEPVIPPLPEPEPEPETEPEAAPEMEVPPMKAEEKTEETEKKDDSSKSESSSKDKSSKDKSSKSKSSKDKKKKGGITLQYYDLTFKVGEGYKLEPSGGDGNYTWSMADSSIATVSDSGAIVAVAPGETILTCTSGDGKSVDVIIRVN